MDHTHESERIGDDLSQGNGMTSVNSGKSVNVDVLDSVVVRAEGSSDSTENWGSRSKVDGVPETAFVANSEKNQVYNGEKGGFGSEIDEMGSSGAAVNAFDTCEPQEIGESQNDPGSSTNPSNLVDVVLETVVVVKSDQTTCLSRENRGLEVKRNELRSSKALVENLSRKVSKTEKESCVIDVKCDGGDGKDLKESPDGERVCRICHLSSEQAAETAATSNTTTTTIADLIQLGCGCKDELGIAHSHCAEAWFKLKGNRLCEICGRTAKNVTGVMDCRFMEEWNERNSSSERGGGCWHGQPFCNFLMACLVIAFVLPWFFRVNMF